VAYATDGIACECEATLLGADPVCRHRAMYWYTIGVLELDDEPEPPTPAAPAATIVPFPALRGDAATAAKAIALVERMAELDGDAPADLLPAA